MASSADLPMAHIGSYATAARPAYACSPSHADRNCDSINPKCVPSALRSASPTQRTAVSPAESARTDCSRTVSSDSPIARRSECPTSTKPAPAFLSIAADTSPVCTPLCAALKGDAVCAPIFMLEFFSACATTGIKVNGAAIHASTPLKFLAFLRKFCAYLTASLGDSKYIFQLAITMRRDLGNLFITCHHTAWTIPPRGSSALART